MSNLAPTTTAERCLSDYARPTLQALPAGPRIPAPAILARPVPRG